MQGAQEEKAERNWKDCTKSVAKSSSACLEKLQDFVKATSHGEQRALGEKLHKPKSTHGKAWSKTPGLDEKYKGPFTYGGGNSSKQPINAYSVKVLRLAYSLGIRAFSPTAYESLLPSQDIP